VAQPAERLAGVLQGGPDHLGRSLGAQPRATASKEIQIEEIFMLRQAQHER